MKLNEGQRRAVLKSSHAHRVTIPPGCHLSLKYLRRLRLLVPPRDDRERIASVYEASDEVVRKHEAALAKLEKLKRDLIQDLLTGRVRVKLPASSGKGGMVQ